MKVSFKTQQIIVWGIAFVAVFTLFLILGTKAFYSFIVPKAQSVSQLSTFVVFGFAFLAGVAAFFSPCPFSIFPSYIAYYLNIETERSRGKEWRHALKIGSMVSLGIFSFYFVVGITLAIFGTALVFYINWLKLAVIPIFFILGLMLVTGKSFSIKKIDIINNRIAKKARDGKHFFSMYLYGIVYGIAAASCHLPILLVLALFPILAGNFIVGLITFLIYALGVSMFFVIFTVIASRKKNFLIKNLGLYGERVKKVAGVIFILTALYLISFYVFFSV